MDHTLEKSSVGGGQPRTESDANTSTRNTRNSDFTGAQGSQLQTTHDHISNRPSNQQKDTSVNQRASNHHEQASENLEHGTIQNVFTLGRTEVTNNTSEVVSKFSELLGTTSLVLLVTSVLPKVKTFCIVPCSKFSLACSW